MAKAATAGVGDNTKADRDRRTLFSYFHRKHRDLEAQRRAIGEEIKTVKQNAKANGFASQKLDHYLKAFQAEDDQKPVDRMKSDRENLSWLGLIQDNPQGDLLADRATNEQMIQAKGFHAGLTGLEKMSHYTGGSSEDRMWCESYDLGRKEYETAIPDIMARISAVASKEEPPATSDAPFGTTEEALEWAKADPNDPKH